MPAKKNRNRRSARQHDGLRGRRRPQVEPLENRLLLASDWTNAINVYDVDAAQTVDSVAPIDALLVINEINNRTVSDPVTGLLPELGENDLNVDTYYDVNGDGYVSPIDALRVINQLNLNSAPSNDAPAFAAASVIVGSRAALAGGISDDTLVNTETSHVQKLPDVASTSLGDSVVVWQSAGQDGRGWGIYGQRFDPTGAAVGGEFRVNTTTKGGQTAPAVAIAEDGSFVAVWQSLGTDGSGFGIYSQRYDSSGNAVGGETLVNTTTRGKQAHPDVVFHGNDYTVVWQGRGAGDVNGIYARTFTNGVGGAEMLVNTYTRGFQGSPVIDANSNGNIVVAWQGKGAGDSTGVYMRDIGTGGAQILVNVSSRGNSHMPAVAVADGGEIAVVWRTPPNGILARGFAADGTGGSIIQVNQTSRGVQTQPDVDALVGGGFVATWNGKGVGDHVGSFARTFNADGTASSDELLVNQTTRAAQVRPSVASANEGYIVAWQGRGAGDRYGTFARFFETGIAGPFSVNPIADGTIDEGGTFTATVTVSDTDSNADNPTFSFATAPSNATIDPTTGVISWTTSESDGPGTFEFTVTATAGEFSSSDTFMVTVNEVNAAPVLAAISDVSVAIDNATTFSVSATDSDLPVQTLTFTATGMPTWLSFNAATQTFSGTPTDDDAGTSAVTVTVDDGNTGTDSQTFNVTVMTNAAPIVSTPIADTSVDEAAALDLNVSGNFSDPEGDTITYSSDNLPAWVSLDANSGALSGTPGSGDVGVVAVNITATDSFGGSVTDTFNLTVVDVNTLTPFVLESSFRVAPTATVGTSVGTVFAQDLDPSDTLAYSITDGNADGAFAIDSATGELTVADATALAALPAVNTLTVAASDGTNSANGTVTVAIDPGAAVVAYSLQVVDPANSDAVLTSVSAGQTVHLVLSVQTVGAGSPGVFSAYADIVYNPDTASIATLDPALCEPAGAVVRINGNVCHSGTYPNGQFANVTTVGLINEAGGTDGLAPLGDSVIEVLRVPMTIGNVAPGTIIAFDTNNADAASIRATTIFNGDSEVPLVEQTYGGAMVTVAQPSVAASAAAIDAAFADDDEDE